MAEMSKLVSIEREVDSGLEEETNSLSSRDIDDDIDDDDDGSSSNDDGAAPSRDIGGGSAPRDDGVIRRNGGSFGNIPNDDFGDNVITVVRDDETLPPPRISILTKLPPLTGVNGDNNTIENRIKDAATNDGYFRSPLEVDMERKLKLLRAEGSLLEKVKKGEAKRLSQRQASFEAEKHRTRDIWKSLYYESKETTLPLEARVTTLSGSLEKHRDGILRNMKIKVVERSWQRKAGVAQVAAARARKFQQRRNWATRNPKIESKGDEFTQKLEEKKMKKIMEEIRKLGIRVKEAEDSLEGKKKEKEEERERVGILKRELKKAKGNLERELKKKLNLENGGT